jgi:hypothetical protein
MYNLLRIAVRVHNVACRAVSRQRLGKHFYAALQVLLEALFPTRSVQRDCMEGSWEPPLKEDLNTKVEE